MSQEEVDRRNPHDVRMIAAMHLRGKGMDVTTRARLGPSRR
ncbi:MAG TPA: hypothetical protein VE987_06250 [Polyangiaceae bacterium]|nr:hypothetical protein [Polyangiaceae bacterium]